MAEPCRRCGGAGILVGNSGCSRCIGLGVEGSKALWDYVEVKMTKPNKRAAILDTAKGYVTKDRQATHGEPEDSFGMIARLWSAYLGQEIKSHDVCSMMALLKVARAKSNPANDDNWVDMAGYAACGAEVAK